MSTASCSRIGCPIAIGGLCLEGFAPPDECPNFVPGSDEPTPAEADLTAEPRVDLGGIRRDDIPIHSGSALSGREATVIARAALTRVVTIAGMEESGKSALVTSIFHKLLEAPFAGYAFAGSRTLPAFDERCYRARIESGRIAPTMERTLVEPETRFLHLRLSSESNNNIQTRGHSLGRDILLTDMPGEAFRHARDNIVDAQRLMVLRRTDHLALLLDGALVADGARRQGARRDTLALLRSLLDADMIDKTTAVELVVTKWDLIADAPNRDEIERFIIEVERDVHRFAGRLAQLRMFRIAALPTRTSKALGYGVDDLLRTWINESAIIGKIPRPNPAVLSGMAREYARFALRFLHPLEARRGSEAPPGESPGTVGSETGRQIVP